MAFNFTRYLNAAALGLFELIPFGTPLLVVIFVRALGNAGGAGLWFTPDWWIAIVFMMFETLRDGMRTLKPKYKGLDGISFASLIGSALVLATIFLAYSIMHGEQPGAHPIPDWIDPVQKGFLFFSITSLWLVKSLVKNVELLDLKRHDAGPTKES